MLLKLKFLIKTLNYLFFRNSTASEQEVILNLLWKLWPQLPAYGRKAAQFVDLLGYFSLKTSQAGKKVITNDTIFVLFGFILF